MGMTVQVNLNLKLNEKDVCSKYIELKSSIQVAKFFKVSKPTILAILHKHNVIQKRERPKDLNEEEVIKLYYELRSGVLVANKLGRKGHHAVLKIINKNKLNKSSIHRKYRYDETYFEKIDNEEKAYFLGFIFADGCVRKTKDNKPKDLKIKIHKKDIEILEAFKKSIKSESPIKIEKDGAVSFSIGSKKICSDLIKLNCTPSKSLTLIPPNNIPNKLIRHFIRGYFDGDGCISVIAGKEKKRTAFILGTKEMLLYFNKHFVKFGFSDKLDKIKPYRKEHVIHIISYDKNDDLKKMIDFFYKDATIYMSRKYNRFIHWDEWRKNNGRCKTS